MPADRNLRSLLLAVPAGVRRDYAASVVVQWFTLGIGLVLFHLVARRGNVDGFAYYQISRGAVSTLQPLAMAGLGTGLQRYLPRSGSRAPVLARRGFAVQLVISTAFALAGIALAGPIGRLFGLGGGRAAVAAIGAALAGNCLATTAVAALRGTGQVAYANAATLAGLALVPLLTFALAALLAEPIEVFLVLQGAGMAAVALAGVAATRRPPGEDRAGAPTLTALVRYGLRRTPGDLALPALFAFPTFAVAAALPGAPDAGFVGFATSAVTLICSLFGMLTPVLLPRLSGYFHQPGGGASLHRGLLALPPVAAGLAAGIALVIGLPAPALIRGFLGPDFAGAERVLRLALLAAVPLAVFYAVRPSLDALQEVPVTVGLLVACLGVEVLLTYSLRLVLSPPAAAVLALCLAATVLGVASYLALTRAMAARSV